MANRKIEATDRSMSPKEAEGGELYFFPKRNPPVSVRAASLEEAEAQIGIEQGESNPT